jgi:hypothetical protein
MYIHKIIIINKQFRYSTVVYFKKHQGEKRAHLMVLKLNVTNYKIYKSPFYTKFRLGV